MLPGIHSLIENLAIPYFLSSLHSCPSSTFSSVAVPSSIAEVSSVFLSCTFSLFLILRIKSSANITKKERKAGKRTKLCPRRSGIQLHSCRAARGVAGTGTDYST